MRCHECNETAAYAPQHDGVRVGLCETHMREYMASLERSLSREAIALDR